MLLVQSQRHINGNIADINIVTNALQVLGKNDCELRRRLLIRGQTAAETFQSWKDLQKAIDFLRKHGVCEEELLIGVEGSISNWHTRLLTFRNNIKGVSFSRQLEGNAVRI